MTLVYSSQFTERDYALASKLIDDIFSAKKKSRVVLERNRFIYVPGNGTRKMVIRLKKFS